MSKFKPGQSGNPGGRPKGFAEVRELAREHTVAAIEKLVAIMTTGQSEQAQLLAANSLLDRGWGKPTQPIGGDYEAPPVRIDAESEFLALVNRIAAARDHPGDFGEFGGPGGAVSGGDTLISAAEDEGRDSEKPARGPAASDSARMGLAGAP
jgi:hypothetical protein